MPGIQELPETIRRSPKKARDTWVKAHDSAVETYGEGRRAHMTAFAAMKHSFEKVGDHWEPKPKKGPPAKATVPRPRGTAEGVSATASKEHLMKVAAGLDVHGRSKMTKEELVNAIKKANRRASAKARR
ncbi:ChaB family protein [Nonomuraea sp. NPDC005983]|uniref:ChaB family protein n=1 Tax=Nonomuraea sp. NPDC005983 TaxID=3155595 RepID=UPI0033B5EF3D